MRTSRSLKPNGSASSKRLDSQSVLVTGSTESPSTVTSTDRAEMSGSEHRCRTAAAMSLIALGPLSIGVSSFGHDSLRLAR